MLECFGISTVHLISGNRSKKKALIDNGIQVKSLRHYSGKIINLGDSLKNFINAVNEGRAETPIFIPTSNEKRIFVIGDLNVDYQIQGIAKGQTIDKPKPKVGGTGFNAALEFMKQNLNPILFGKVGDDENGRIIKEELNMHKFNTLLGLHPNKPTGSCSLLFFEGGWRWLMQDTNNANDYNLKDLEQALAISKIGKNDIIFLVAHSFYRNGPDHGSEIFRLINSTGAKIVLDLVPHNLYEKITLDDLNKSMNKEINLIIGAFHTLKNFISTIPEYEDYRIPANDDYRKISGQILYINDCCKIWHR